MRAAASAQAKDLRRRLALRLAGAVAVYTAVFAIACLIANETIVPDIADLVASATAPWSYLDEEQYLEVQQALADAGRNLLDTWITADGMYAVRDLSMYYAFSSLKIPVAVIIYLVGFVAIVVAVLNGAIRAFDAVSGAVTQLLADPTRPIFLPDELAIVRAEIGEVRERALADQRAAHAAEQRKNELVAYLAHDIKTPLTSVIGYTSLLAEAPDLPQETRERYARTAYDKAVRLDGLIDEFFEITRYNLAAIPIERDRVDAGVLCRQVADELFPEASERGIVVDVRAPEGIVAFIDPDKMARALSNIVRNAVAYAFEGTTVIVRAEATAVGHLRIAVENEGREISKAHLESIFEKFFREDGARGSNSGGAGLGLAIAKEIVVAHGGAISANSENGRTTFAIDVPL